MNTQELLLTTCTSTNQSSACLWDYNSLNSIHLYRNAISIVPKTLKRIGNDYLLSAEIGKCLLHVWPLNTSEVAKNIRLILPEPAQCLDICPKNCYLAVGINLKLYVWQLSSGKLLSVQQKNFQPITCVKFSSDGDYLTIAGQDGMVITYKLGDLVSLRNNYLTQSDLGQVEPVYTKNDHSLPVRDIHIGIFNRKSRLATVSSDQTCRLYQLTTGEQLLVLIFDEPLTSVVFDNPCFTLYVGTNSGLIKQFNLKNPPRSLEHHVNIEESHKTSFVGPKKKVVNLSLNITNKILASSSEEGIVYTWDIASKQILKKIENQSSVMFTLYHPNFDAQTLKPSIMLKNLDRVLDNANDRFKNYFVQNSDINLSDDENSLEKEKSRYELESKNLHLSVVNKQLYEAAINLTKKYHSK